MSGQIRSHLLAALALLGAGPEGVALEVPRRSVTRQFRFYAEQ